MLMEAFAAAATHSLVIRDMINQQINNDWLIHFIVNLKFKRLRRKT